jgi:hypothetical protein
MEKEIQKLSKNCSKQNILERGKTEYELDEKN